MSGFCNPAVLKNRSMPLYFCAKITISRDMAKKIATLFLYNCTVRYYGTKVSILH